MTVIRVYDGAANVIETHEHKGDFKEWQRPRLPQRLNSLRFYGYKNKDLPVAAFATAIFSVAERHTEEKKR